MSQSKKSQVSKWAVIGFLMFGIAGIFGLGSLVTRAIEKVSSGHGLDTYRTVWLVEFNYIGLLVLVGSFILIFLIGAIMHFVEFLQLRALEKKYGSRNENT